MTSLWLRLERFHRENIPREKSFYIPRSRLLLYGHPRLTPYLTKYLGSLLSLPLEQNYHLVNTSSGFDEFTPVRRLKLLILLVFEGFVFRKISEKCWTQELRSTRVFTSNNSVFYLSWKVLCNSHTTQCYHLLLLKTNIIFL